MIATDFVFPQNQKDDILFALLVTDEVVTNDAHQPCLDTNLVNAFNSYNPIFGAIFIDESRNDSLLSLFLESVKCFSTNYSNNYSVIETNSSIDASQSFHSFYKFVDDIDANDLNFNTDSCETMVNISWPGVDFEYFVPVNGIFILCYILHIPHIIELHRMHRNRLGISVYD